MLKSWGKETKSAKRKNLGIPKKRKTEKDCTAEEYEMVYGYPDWTDIKSKQAK